MKGNTHGIFLSVKHTEVEVVVGIVTVDGVLAIDEVVEKDAVDKNALVVDIDVGQVSVLQYPQLSYCPLSFNDVAHQYLALKLAHMEYLVDPKN